METNKVIEIMENTIETLERNHKKNMPDFDNGFIFAFKQAIKLLKED